MAALKKIQVLKRLDFLIQKKATGTPEELASRFEVSRATIFRYIAELKGMDAPIKYCSFRDSYYYEQDFQLIF